MRTHQLRYDTRALAKLDIVDWIEGFYNHRRMHSSIGYKTRLLPNPASWLRKVVYVESRQGHFNPGTVDTAL